MSDSLNNTQKSAPGSFSTESPDERDQALAVRLEVIYLINLMLLPGLAFLVLIYLYRKHGNSPSRLVRNHLRQTVGTSLLGGTLLVIVIASILLFGGLSTAYTWVAVIVYFTLIHSSLILCGAIGLSRAMVGKTVQYPLIGRFLDPEAA
jgi:uncharacterized membrane protein YtjA (UPF0391 family)